MTITQMKYFVEVAKRCSFSEAANELYVSRQALSKQIQALEHEVDTPLFERNSKRVALTNAGKYLLREWEPMIKRVEENVEHIRYMSAKQSIRVGIPDISGILDILIPFIQTHLEEGQRVEYVVDSINNLIGRFHNKSVDILILFHGDLNEIRTQYYYSDIIRMPYGMICHKSHPLAHRQEITIKDIENETMCHFDASYMKYMEKDIKEHFATFGLAPKEVRSYSNWRNMEIGLRMKEGITLTYEAFLPSESEHLAFVPIRERANEPIHNLIVVWHEEPMSVVAELFKEAFR